MQKPHQGSDYDLIFEVTEITSL